MKIRCLECEDMATWVYTPMQGGHYCDGCVPRGCSCWWNEETQEMHKGTDGREFPCVEYDESEDGFDDEKTIDDSDRFDEE